MFISSILLFLFNTVFSIDEHEDETDYKKLFSLYINEKKKFINKEKDIINKAHSKVLELLKNKKSPEFFKVYNNHLERQHWMNLKVLLYFNLSSEFFLKNIDYVKNKAIFRYLLNVYEKIFSEDRFSSGIEQDILHLSQDEIEKNKLFILESDRKYFNEDDFLNISNFVKNDIKDIQKQYDSLYKNMDLKKNFHDTYTFPNNYKFLNYLYKDSDVNNFYQRLQKVFEDIYDYKTKKYKKKILNNNNFIQIIKDIHSFLINNIKDENAISYIAGHQWCYGIFIKDKEKIQEEQQRLLGCLSFPVAHFLLILNDIIVNYGIPNILNIINKKEDLEYEEDNYDLENDLLECISWLTNEGYSFDNQEMNNKIDDFIKYRNDILKKYMCIEISRDFLKIIDEANKNSKTISLEEIETYCNILLNQNNNPIFPLFLIFLLFYNIYKLNNNKNNWAT